jgi:hypothetical protein
MSWMRWRRCVVVVTLACGCWHPIAWTPEGQRLVDDREGRPRAPEQVQPSFVDEDAPPPPEEEDAGAVDAGPAKPRGTARCTGQFCT